MAVIKCPGCKKTFETSGGLSSHGRSCKTPINALAKQILDKHRDLEDSHMKRPRFGRNRIVIQQGTQREEIPQTSVEEQQEVRGMDAEAEANENQPSNVPLVSSSHKFFDMF
jgi:hypothetical protein